MPYKVIKQFKDKEDKGRLYEVGDEYPKGSFKPTNKRLNELSELHPHYKAAFIKEEEQKKPVDKKQPKDSKSKE